MKPGAVFVDVAVDQGGCCLLYTSHTFDGMQIEELAAWNKKLYSDILPEHYRESYANPDYACLLYTSS